MSDKMHITELKELLTRIIEEYSKEKSIFGIPEIDFYKEKADTHYYIFDDASVTPIGPAAGPHTQLTQNIVSAYLTGGRFFELKTVQILDELTVEKPCIDSYDECYNVEWSQELKLHESFDEYIKAWFILHFLRTLLNPQSGSGRGFIFNMSVGYNLEGIKQERMQTFINSMIDASKSSLFSEYKNYFLAEFNGNTFKKFLEKNFTDYQLILQKLQEIFENISPKMSNSVTLSTMHGCPPEEIESIAKYLISEKGLNTYVKLNPTLLGYQMVNETLTKLGYSNVFLNEHSFESDLKFIDAVPMITRLKEFAFEHKKEFGVKLSNTLAVKNKRDIMPGEEMYMSGRSLFPLTINVAAKLAETFKGELNISFSGGASIYNSDDILKCGIFPITYATDLLKPGGYRRLNQIANKLDNEFNGDFKKALIDIDYLQKLAESSLTDLYYKKEKRSIESIKVDSELPPFDCFIAPCSVACPIHQDVAEYIRLVEEKKYDEAFEVIVSKNALPNITAHICDHQCMYHCTRWDYDSPVEIRDYKKIASLNGYESYIKKFKAERERNQNSIPIAVIGAGPSGLSASYFLARAGFYVTVFDKKEKAGGVVQNIIPDFRLPQSAIDKDIEFIKQLGVNFIFNAESDFSVQSLKEKGFKYIYISIGAELSNSLQLDNEDANVIDALDFLAEYHSGNAPRLGKIAAIVGGGNSAMDAARAAKRIANVETVYIVYRRTTEYMPADKEEIEAAIKDGVIFKELLLPVGFSNRKIKCQKMKLGDIDKDKRRKVIPIENEFEYIEIDTLITAIGESVDTELLNKNKVALNSRSKVEVDKVTNETSIENVYIGGDALRGPSTVVESISDGKKAAEAIIKKENININFNKDFSSKFNLEKRIEEITKNKSTVYISDSNKSRCLECNIICNKCIDVCPNRANVAIKTSSDSFTNVNQILHLDGVCNECGNCETFCPHQGAPYRDKVTLFRNKEDFDDSKNEGFYLTKESDTNIIASIRFRSFEEDLVFTFDGKLVKRCSDESDKAITKLEEIIGIVISNYSYLLN